MIKKLYEYVPYVAIACMGLVWGTTYTYYSDLTFRHSIQFPATFATKIPLKPFDLDPNTLTAKSAIVYDPVSKIILFQKDAQAQRPLASLTKLATTRAVLSSAGPNQMVIISKDAVKADGDSGLHPGDVWRLADLVAFGLTTSSNDAMAAAASVLSSGTAVERMNDEAQKDGLAQSYFLNPTGLDLSSSTAGAYGSALDVAHLTELVLREYPDIFGATAHQPKPEANSGKGIISTTEPVWNVPGLIGAKTGYTDLAGGNLTVAVDLGLNQPVIAVVLGSTHDGRFSDIEKLIESARASLTQ